MRFTTQWVGVILAAAGIDLLFRLGIAGSYQSVLWVEAILFPLAGLTLHLIFRSRGRSHGFRGWLQVASVWAFILAGVRSGIWAAGVPVGVANLVILFLALLGWLGSRLRKGRGSGRV